MKERKKHVKQKKLLMDAEMRTGMVVVAKAQQPYYYNLSHSIIQLMLYCTQPPFCHRYG